MPRHPFEPLRGRIEHHWIDSANAAANVLGDPGRRRVPVYVAEGADEVDGGVPLLIDLVGYTSSGPAHLNWKPFQESVPARVDRLIAEGRMGPVAVAFPDCFTSLGGNQYINSAATGRWADFLIEDLVPALEARLPVRGGAAKRGLFGKSSGGYGAIVHGLCYGEHWGAVACHSGDMGFEWCFRSDFPKMLTMLERHGGLSGFLGHVRETENLSGDEMHALMIAAMGAFYDPDPSAPGGIRLPVDPYDGRVDEERWARWLEHDPVRLVERPDCREQLQRLRGIFVDCGSRDTFHLHYGARQLSQRLSAHGIAHRHEEFDDTHSGIDYRMDVSLPWLYRTLAGEAAAGR